MTSDVDGAGSVLPGNNNNLSICVDSAHDQHFGRQPTAEFAMQPANIGITCWPILRIGARVDLLLNMNMRKRLMLKSPLLMVC